MLGAMHLLPAGVHAGICRGRAHSADSHRSAGSLPVDHSRHFQRTPPSYQGRPFGRERNVVVLGEHVENSPIVGRFRSARRGRTLAGKASSLAMIWSNTPAMVMHLSCCRRGEGNEGVSLLCSENKKQAPLYTANVTFCRAHAMRFFRCERSLALTGCPAQQLGRKMPHRCGCHRQRGALLQHHSRFSSLPRARVGQLGFCNLDFFQTGVVVSSTTPGRGARSYL